MTRKTTLLAGAAVFAVAVVGVLCGLYLIIYAYPALVNERFETREQNDTPGPARVLVIGKVSHGKQFLEPADPQLRGQPGEDLSRLATTYYHREGPVGRAMELMNWFGGAPNTYAADARMPASQVGLCASLSGLPLESLVGVWSEPPYAAVFIKDGCLASYARPFQCVDFYERNAAFIELSEPPAGQKPRFTFVRDARDRGANLRIIEGSERTQLADNGPRKFYQVLVVDTSRGRTDILSQELMTQEALNLYFDVLTDDGVLLIHTSNRQYDLTPALADTALSLGFSCVRLMDGRGGGGAPVGHFSSEWVLIARAAGPLARVRARVPRPGPGGGIQWAPLLATGNPPWTDNASNSVWRLRR
jgi:hypothetical protein